MQNHITPEEIASRLLLAILAGTLIGFNRGEHGHPAGLRTTLLVCLAACVSMIQVNLLLPSDGRSSTSYIMMDLMRLPLGILSGMGFIGAGAILRRDNLVVGVTTAATLWFVTVIGLCFGGGQWELGLSALGLALFILWPLKFIETRCKQERKATLTLVSSREWPTEQEVKDLILTSGFGIESIATSHEPAAKLRELKCLVNWRGPVRDANTPRFVEELAQRSDTLRVAWQP